MSAYDNVPCEDCGEMVSMHPMSQKKHQRECTMSPEVKENKTVEKPKETKFKNAEDQTMYDIAMRAQETRKKAPELYVAGVHSDERRELIKRYAPECVDPPL